MRESTNREKIPFWIKKFQLYCIPILESRKTESKFSKATVYTQNIKCNFLIKLMGIPGMNLLKETFSRFCKLTRKAKSSKSMRKLGYWGRFAKKVARDVIMCVWTLLQRLSPVSDFQYTSAIPLPKPIVLYRWVVTFQRVCSFQKCDVAGYNKLKKTKT